MPAPFPPQRPECLSDEWIVLRREVLARSEEARSLNERQLLEPPVSPPNGCYAGA
jgi:hypothetical protein